MMKIMGLPSITHLLSWFIKYFILLSIGSLLLAILLTTRLYSDPFFYHSNVWAVFCFLVVFSCSLIAFTFLVSTFFSKGMAQLIWGKSYCNFFFCSNYSKFLVTDNHYADVCTLSVYVIFFKILPGQIWG